MTNQHSSELLSRPFVSAPDPGRYFPAGATEEARRRISRIIERGEGPALVIGSAGMGKTTLLEVLATQFREHLNTVCLAGAQLCTRRALLQMILFRIGLPYRELDEGELRLSLHNYLLPQDGNPKRILLLVDEADSLPSRLLEELRALTNLCAGGQILVSLVLAGNANLEERFAAPELEVFSQRISTRCYLSAFGREETFQYVRSQIAAAGQDPDASFSPEALEAIFAATDGVPRLINQLGDQLMWTIAKKGDLPLNGATVQQAWSELQQLPAPWNTQQHEASMGDGTVVEFGELDNADAPVDEAVFQHVGEHLEEDNFETTEDDELPASIPINSSQHAPTELFSTANIYAETIDATEQLLQQLQEIDTEIVAIEQAAEAKQPSHSNPFDEQFAFEEVLQDQYSKFESQLLASAPHVINRMDSAFAGQLNRLELPQEQSLEDADPAPIQESPAPSIQEEIPSPELVPTTPEPEVEELPSSTPFTESPGDVLVVEDKGRIQAEVVPGRQFRRLFSSLQSG